MALRNESTSRMTSIDEEIFEITDFTCVTDWERFVGDLESRIREWQMNDENQYISIKDAQPTKFGNKTDSLKYGERTTLKISYIYPLPSLSSSTDSKRELLAKKTTKVAGINEISKLQHVPPSVRDLLDQNIDFMHESVDLVHHVVRYYGLRRFIVLEPASFASSSSNLTDDSFINLLMSAILVASLNSNCDLPIFLQVCDQWRWLYNGICQNRDTRTYFEMVHLRTPPPKCCHLSGILDMFKEQVACLFTPPPAVKISLRISYDLHEPFESNWHTRLEEVEESPESLISVKDFGRLPFGAVEDPIEKFYLAATWLNLNEDMLVENDVYSDLDPLTAPYWNATVEFLETGALLFTEALSDFLKLTECDQTVDEILGPCGTETSAAGALSRLTDSSYLELSALQTAMKKHTLSPLSSPSSIKDGQAPLDDVALTRLLQFLFPDSGLEQKEDKKRRYKRVNGKEKGSNESRNKGDIATPGSAVSVSSNIEAAEGTGLLEKGETLDNVGFKILLRKSKAAPPDSLVNRLALATCHLSKSMQGVCAVCHLWREFVLELRYRWENGITLPGFDSSNPSLADCLLHQKLQMFNCCILHKLKRQKHQMAGDHKAVVSSDSSKSGDEFYDCYEDTSEIDLATVSKPEGRLRPLAADAFLLDNAKEHLYIPITQDPAPVTEDILEQYGRMLTNMGTSDESAFARAKMQTPSLLSDMEAFKAANPSSRMEDFIRWYSPRDWIEESDRETGLMTGHLSDRMSTPGNLWHEVWESARPVPVSRQKRLFDDTTEAEKILHWLYGMRISELVQYLSPALFWCGLIQLYDEANAVNRFLGDQWKALANGFVSATMVDQSTEYQELCPLIADIERMISRYRSLVVRFLKNVHDAGGRDPESDADLEIQNFALDLLTEKDIPILGASRGMLGTILTNMFSKDDRLRFEPKSESVRFPPFYSKEYILRWSVPRPQATSRECPQRCYVRVKANEFRAASAFTEDIVFFLPDRL